jgi:hypothetical protein
MDKTSLTDGMEETQQINTNFDNTITHQSTLSDSNQEKQHINGITGHFDESKNFIFVHYLLMIKLKYRLSFDSTVHSIQFYLRSNINLCYGNSNMFLLLKPFDC